MHTTGLGGDSEVHFISEGLTGGVTLGPRRRIPLSLIAAEAPDVVLHALERQLGSSLPGEYDAEFLRAVPNVSRDGLGSREEGLLDRIGQDVHPTGNILKSRVDSPALRRLVDRGLVQIASITPSDASHVLGWTDAWNSNAARMGLELIGRRRTGAGDVLTKDPIEMAQIIVNQLTQQTSLALLECAFSEETDPFGPAPQDLARHVLMQRGLDGHLGLVQVQTGLAVDVIGLGASAATYYPAVGDRLGCKMILPKYGDVANAIGAVVGRVTIRKSGTITAHGEGSFRVHVEAGPQDFDSQEKAFTCLEASLSEEARSAARISGVNEIDINISHEIKSAKVESREVFLEATINVEASGRPSIAETNSTP